MNYQDNNSFKARFPNIKSGREILEMQFPPREWLIDDLLPIGSAILVGPPKIGKSYFVLNLIQIILARNYEVFYFAGEDDYRRIQTRMTQIGIDSEKVFFLAGRVSPLAPKGKDAIDEIREIILSRPAIKAVFIDTMASIMTGRIDLSDYFGFVERLKPWADLASELDINITMVHHSVKGNNQPEHNPLNLVLGSQAIAGTFDTNMTMYRAADGNGATLYLTGKDVEENEYRLSKKEFGWEIEGLESIASLGETQTKVYLHIKTHPNQTWTQIKNALEIDGGQLSKTLEKLTFDNIIEKCDGEYNALV